MEISWNDYFEKVIPFPGAIIKCPKLASIKNIIEVLKSHLSSTEFPSVIMSEQEGLPYEFTPQLAEAIMSKVVIFIDSLEKFFLIENYRQILAGKVTDCKLIFFVNFGVSAEDISRITDIILDIQFLEFKVSTDDIEFIIKPRVVNMNSYQDKEYSTFRHEEIINVNSFDRIKQFESNNFLLSMKAGNISYPQDVLSKKFPDAITMAGGWINHEVVENMGEYSTKLHQLLTNITLNKDKKHVIYSRYLHRYGVDLINACLMILKLKTFVLTPEMSQRKRLELINEFNSEIIGVFICDVFPHQRLNNVSEVHFFEGIDIDLFLDFLDKIYLRGNYSVPISKLQFNFWISQREDGKDAADMEYYKTFDEAYLNLKRDYDNLKPNQIITYSRGGKLSVKI